jgi:hypothetical protein
VSDPKRDAAAGDRRVPRDTAPARAPIEPSLTCPNCGAVLDARSCKLICPTQGCGYYLSCSDYY